MSSTVRLAAVIAGECFAVGIAGWAGWHTAPPAQVAATEAPSPARLLQDDCAPAPGEDPVRIAEIEAILGREARRRADAEEEYRVLFGDADPATPDAIQIAYDPGADHPDVIEAEITRLFAACRPPARVVHYECVDGDCMAVVAGDASWLQALRACEAWGAFVKVYGKDLHTEAGAAVCDDGTEAFVDLWGPIGTDLSAQDVAALEARADAAAAEWGCPDAR